MSGDSKQHWAEEPLGGSLFSSAELRNCYRIKAQERSRFRDFTGTKNDDGITTWVRDPWWVRLRVWWRVKWNALRWKTGAKVLKILGMKGEDYCECEPF